MRHCTFVMLSALPCITVLAMSGVGTTEGDTRVHTAGTCDTRGHYNGVHRDPQTEPAAPRGGRPYAGSQGGGPAAEWNIPAVSRRETRAPDHWAPFRTKPPQHHQPQPQQTNYWAPLTRKRGSARRPHGREGSDDQGRTGDRPGPRTETNEGRNVTRGILSVVRPRQRAQEKGCLNLPL